MKQFSCKYSLAKHKEPFTCKKTKEVCKYQRYCPHSRKYKLTSLVTSCQVAKEEKTKTK